MVLLGRSRGREARVGRFVLRSPSVKNTSEDEHILCRCPVTATWSWPHWSLRLEPKVEKHSLVIVLLSGEREHLYLVRLPRCSCLPVFCPPLALSDRLGLQRSEQNTSRIQPSRFRAYCFRKVSVVSVEAGALVTLPSRQGKLVIVTMQSWSTPCCPGETI